MIDYLYNLATDKYNGIFHKSIKLILFIISLVYGMLVRCLILFYRIKPYRLNCRVVSIGNITLGGTGKTPLVEFFARSLKNDGYKVAVLSRGYKKKQEARGGKQDKRQEESYESMGDEPYMLSRKLGDIPVIVDSNRIRAAKRAIKENGVNTVVLDDGFQQWRIKKDSEIVAIDATNPFGNRHMLPRGILREPLSSLKRADIIVLTKTNINPDIQDIKDYLSQLAPAAKIFESVHLPAGFYRLASENQLEAPQSFKDKPVALFCGIGDPDSFENLILSLGIKVEKHFRFSDHHNYREKDLDRIIASCKEAKIDTIITTDKDAARLRSPQLSALSARFWALRIELKITHK